MQQLIQAKGLSKYFGNFRAVHEVSFHVNAGEVYGLLGPNGAGKTTTLRMLAGILQPTSGEVTMAEHSMVNDQIRARKKLGFLTGDMDLYQRLNPVEVLKYFGQLYGMEKNALAQRTEQLIEWFDIGDFKNKMCGKLSTGQKQRVSIARTIVHDPMIVILDEPTTGLDIMSSEFILNFIHKMAKEQEKAVIFSTHNLTEVERLCDRIGIIAKGEMIATGSIEAVKEIAQQNDLASAFFELVTD